MCFLGMGQLDHIDRPPTWNVGCHLRSLSTITGNFDEWIQWILKDDGLERKRQLLHILFKIWIAMLIPQVYTCIYMYIYIFHK